MSSWNSSYPPPPRRSRSRSPARGSYPPRDAPYPPDQYRDWEAYDRDRAWASYDRERPPYDYRRGRSRSPPPERGCSSSFSFLPSLSFLQSIASASAPTRPTTGSATTRARVTTTTVWLVEWVVCIGYTDFDSRWSSTIRVLVAAPSWPIPACPARAARSTHLRLPRVPQTIRRVVPLLLLSAGHRGGQCGQSRRAGGWRRFQAPQRHQKQVGKIQKGLRRWPGLSRVYSTSSLS